MNSKSKQILTIGIPTYNRAIYLDKCLCEIAAQIENYNDLIIIQISDNASVDNTEEIVRKYIDLGINIDYVKHAENLGMDGNFHSLYQRCSTKYMWMLSDDDFPLPTALDKIMFVLNKEELGVLYLNNLWFNEESDISVDEGKGELVYKRYDIAIEFVNRINYWFTFISGNIINKYIVQEKIAPLEFDKTHIMQLGWIIPAVFQGLPNCVIENNVVACKAENTGGYRLFKVFGENFNLVMDSLISQGYDSRMKDIINIHLLNSFFPIFLNKKNKEFSKEKYMSTMLPVFWKYKIFWRKIFPYLLKQQFNLV